ncbi:MAG TPA: hypothetical protein VHA33_21865 [Candidatus Angelobacter sp.]|jgi:hypothetical protein|nr:hypothetical protein [Candidatus Angelobacter sp.]
MPSPIAKLTGSAQAELFHDLNYLNMAEIKAFCKKHSIPYTIWIETKDGRRKRTHEQDRKGVILNRIRHFLETGFVLEETCFPSSVVSSEGPSVPLKPEDRLYYGRYDKHDALMTSLLKKLTEGKFKNGAIARILAREFWTKGEAPTFKQFAAAWMRETRDHTRPNPEWAFLSDIANKTAGSNWKRIRLQKAQRVLKILDELFNYY